MANKVRYREDAMERPPEALSREALEELRLMALYPNAADLLATVDAFERDATRYQVLRNGGSDIPDLEWLMGLKPEQFDAALDEVIDARRAALAEGTER